MLNLLEIFHFGSLANEFSLQVRRKFIIVPKASTNAVEEGSGGKDCQKITFLVWEDKSINDFRR